VLTETHDYEEIIERIAALDIGKAELMCCVRVPDADRPIRNPRSGLCLPISGPERRDHHRPAVPHTTSLPLVAGASYLVKSAAALPRSRRSACRA
jgi:hypothetical protein